MSDDDEHQADEPVKFAKVPEALAFSDASDRTIRVYVALVRHGTTPARCFPSHDRLAELCRCSVPSVKRALAELVAGGWVEVHARGAREAVARPTPTRSTRQPNSSPVSYNPPGPNSSPVSCNPRTKQLTGDPFVRSPVIPSSGHR